MKLRQSFRASRLMGFLLLVVFLSLLTNHNFILAAQDATPIPSATPLTPASPPTSIRLILSPTYLIIFIEDSHLINLAELTFQYQDNDNIIRMVKFSDFFFDIETIADPAEFGACYILEVFGQSIPLPNNCQELQKIFKVTIAENDVFWYDAVIAKQIRNLNVFMGGMEIDICSNASKDCSLPYPTITPSPTPTLIPTFTPSPTPTSMPTSTPLPPPTWTPLPTFTPDPLTPTVTLTVQSTYCDAARPSWVGPKLEVIGGINVTLYGGNNAPTGSLGDAYRIGAGALVEVVMSMKCVYIDNGNDWWVKVRDELTGLVGWMRADQLKQRDN